MKKLNSRFKSKFKFLNLLIGAVSLLLVTILPTIAQAQLTDQSQVYIKGIGQVMVGMTVPQASTAANRRLVVSGGGGGSSCFYVIPEGGPSDVRFMVTEGRISRVDISGSSRVTTSTGARIGDTEDRIKALYPGQIQVSPHKYVPGGHYLTFVPTDRAERSYRLLFETNGNQVTKYRTGKLPEVEFVEGCA